MTINDVRAIAENTDWLREKAMQLLEQFEQLNLTHAAERIAAAVALIEDAGQSCAILLEMNRIKEERKS